MKKLLVLCSLFFVFTCSDDNNSNSVDNSQLSDFEGNVYNVLEVGDQLWTTENLKVKTYRDGTPIPFVENYEQWSNLTTGAWCYVNNDPSTEEVYGILYNLYAINNPRGLSPEGSRIPTANDYYHLATSQGVYQFGSNDFDIFKKFLSVDVPWNYYNTNVLGDNSSGFNSRPAGMRIGASEFPAFSRYASFGTNTIEITTFSSFKCFALTLTSASEYQIGFSNRDPRTGVSVRVILD